MVVTNEQQSEDVEVGSTRLASLACDSQDVAYVDNLVFDAHEDYEEDEDNDLEQSDDVTSSSLVADSSPYLDAILHDNDETSYSIVRLRDES